MTQDDVSDDIRQTRGPRRSIVGALLLVSLLASLDQTVVSTALPTIMSELGGIEYLPWVVTAYLLTATAVTPLYGKLGDLFGRKLTLQAAIALLLCGSAFCGMARDMVELVAFRALQGAGAGGLMVTVLAVIADLAPARARGRYQGMFGAVLAVSTIIGPPIGGLFVDHLTWRWIFYINLPLALLALGIISVILAKPPSRRQKPSIDYTGAFLLTCALAGAVLLSSLGGTTVPWHSPIVLALGVSEITLIAAFLIVEARAPEPFVPPVLFANPTVRAASAVGFIIGIALFGSATYLPLYLQVVKGLSPSASGLAIMPMMGGALLASVSSGFVISRTGKYRVFPIAGTAIAGSAMALLSTLRVDSSTTMVMIGAAGVGLGIGMVMQVLILATQNVVSQEQLGVATSAASLFRAIGGLIGVSAFGAILTHQLHSSLSTSGMINSHWASIDIAALRELPPDARNLIIRAFAEALHVIFLTATILTALAFLLTWQLQEMPLLEKPDLIKEHR